MGKVVEFGALRNKIRENSGDRKTVASVLNLDLIVKNVRWENSSTGNILLVLDTNVGEILTGSKVLIRQAKQIIEPEIAKGNTVKVKIVSKPGRNMFSYYTFA